MHVDEMSNAATWKPREAQSLGVITQPTTDNQCFSACLGNAAIREPAGKVGVHREVGPGNHRCFTRLLENKASQTTQAAFHFQRPHSPAGGLVFGVRAFAFDGESVSWVEDGRVILLGKLYERFRSTRTLWNCELRILMFRGYPEPVREACLGLIVGGFLMLVFGGMGLYLMTTDTVTEFGKVLTVVLLVVATAGITAGFLLASRSPIALPVAWFVAAGYLLVAPLGTIVGIIVIKGLLAREMASFMSLSRKKKRSGRGTTTRRSKRRGL